MVTFISNTHKEICLWPTTEQLECKVRTRSTKHELPQHAEQVIQLFGMQKKIYGHKQIKNSHVIDFIQNGSQLKHGRGNIRTHHEKVADILL